MYEPGEIREQEFHGDLSTPNRAVFRQRVSTTPCLLLCMTLAQEPNRTYNTSLHSHDIAVLQQQRLHTFTTALASLFLCALRKVLQLALERLLVPTVLTVQRSKRFVCSSGQEHRHIARIIGNSTRQERETRRTAVLGIQAVP